MSTAEVVPSGFVWLAYNQGSGTVHDGMHGAGEDGPGRGFGHPALDGCLIFPGWNAAIGHPVAATPAAHGHDHGQAHASGHAEPCQDCPTKAFGSLCEMACAAVPVAPTPSQAVGTRLEYPAAFAVPPPRTVHEAVLTPDPLPPRPSQLS